MVNHTIRRPNLQNFSTYRDHLIVFLTLFTFSILYRIRGDHAWIGSTSLCIMILGLVPRLLFPKINWLGKLDAWKPAVASVLWLVYGVAFSTPAAFLFPSWVGGILQIPHGGIAIASFWKMDKLMYRYYQYTLYTQIALALLVPSMDTSASMSSPSHMIFRMFLFYLVWTLNDLRIRLSRLDVYSEVDRILLPVQCLWILLIWYPLAIVFGSALFFWLLFLVSKEAIVFSRKKYDIPEDPHEERRSGSAQYYEDAEIDVEIIE